jgi:hypothetical protein
MLGESTVVGKITLLFLLFDLILRLCLIFLRENLIATFAGTSVLKDLGQYYY